jgi:hypothetical protein
MLTDRPHLSAPQIGWLTWQTDWLTWQTCWLTWQTGWTWDRKKDDRQTDIVTDNRQEKKKRQTGQQIDRLYPTGTAQPHQANCAYRMTYSTYCSIDNRTGNIRLGGQTYRKTQRQVDGQADRHSKLTETDTYRWDRHTADTYRWIDRSTEGYSWTDSPIDT